MKYAAIVIFFILNLSFLYSQTSTEEKSTIFNRIQEGNKILIHQELSIKLLVEKNTELNKKFDGMDGYRIRIYSARGNNAKKLALDVKTDFMKRYPLTDSEMNYISPNFRVVVGNFRTKTEAEKFRREISSDYPGAFIVKETIDLPKL